MHIKFYLRKCRLFGVFIVIKVFFIYYMFQKYGNSLSAREAGSETFDVVYTWVNGSDPSFLESLSSYVNAHDRHDASPQRFDDKYELKFSLRSLEKYAPWVRHVYLVTNGQIPYWLNLDYEKVTVVTHREIFTDTLDLPTFSSPAIESHLHRIPGLSKRFLYFNDDFFLGQPIYPDDFVSPSRGFLVYLAWPVPMCAADCPWLYVGDGQCDRSCLNTDCQMDGGDCRPNQTFDSIHLHETNTKAINQSLQAGASRGVQASQNLRYLFNKTDRISSAVAEHNTKVMRLNKLRGIKRRSKNGTEVRGNERLAFDSYAASLQHTNRVLNLRYGFKARYAAAHSPILIDKDVMEELQDVFAEEFRTTSRNRVRHDDDMQYAFSYYYYLMSERVNRTVDEIFDLYDTDNSGTWSDREIRTLLTQIYDLPLSYSAVDHFESVVFNCSKQCDFAQPPTPEYERYIDSKLPTVSKDLVKKCHQLSTVLIEKFGKRKKYKYHVVKDAQTSDVTFVMLNSNVNEVVRYLDDIRRHTRKFVCMNDNMDDEGGDRELVKAILHDFYLALFPSPSRFELSPDFRNRFLRTDELRSWKAYHFRLKLAVYGALAGLCLLVYLNFCRRRVLYQFINKILC